MFPKDLNNNNAKSISLKFGHEKLWHVWGMRNQVLVKMKPCADPESFVRGGPTLTTFFCSSFLGDEEREDPNTTKSGPIMHLRAGYIECWAW